MSEPTVPNLAGGEPYLTLPYKQVEGGSIYLDIYPPREALSATPGAPLSVPAVVYFHGGGLTVGNRRSWFPAWFHRRIVAAGYAFISADYRLLPASTGHSILVDIKDLFVFISRDLNLLLGNPSSWVARSDNAQAVPGRLPKNGSCFPQFCVDASALAVAGTSAGGLCAYLAAMHVDPKPRALVSMYGMGGNLTTRHYLAPKSTPFFLGREILDPAPFSEYIYPLSASVQVTSDSQLIYHPASSPTPGYPANPRMLLIRLYLQQGTFLDYYTGEHNPSLSATLRELLEPHSSKTADSDTYADSIQQLISNRHRNLFPQFGVTSSWPPTFLLHGSSDSAVSVQESYYLKTLIERAGVPVTLAVADGQEHSFDYEQNVEDLYGPNEFDSIGEFLRKWLKPVAAGAED